MAAAMVGTALAAPVAAAPQSRTVDRTITVGPTDLGGTIYHVTGVISGDITVTAEATLTQPIRETLAYDDAFLRQGQTLGVGRSVATNGPGNLHVTWHVVTDLPVIAGTFDTSANKACTLSFTSPVPCGAESTGFELIPNPLNLLQPYADLVLQADVKVTPDDATVDSTELAGVVTIGGPESQNEPGTQDVEIPCTTGAGDILSLSDADYSLATHINSKNGPAIDAGTWVGVPPFVTKLSLGQLNLGPQHAESFTENIADPTVKVTALGPIAANNIAPHASAGGPYVGKLEGVPVQFDGSGTTSICGFDSLTLRWDFSDGGVAFGTHPFHTFADNGVFSGLLTATDPTGLSNSKAFSVTVGNQNPVVDAGPDTTADWGRLVAFNGQATDPGAGDQSTLQYTWDFGDGTPTASGGSGSGVFHAYASPGPGLGGSYVATMTVTDKDGGSSSDTRTVFVTKRDVTAAYLGPTAAIYDTGTSFSGSLVDEYGQNVGGRTIRFSVGGAGQAMSATNSSGIATASWTPTQDAASYPTDATFLGDSLYNADSDAGNVAIARKGTSVTYTGALNGGPNKTVGLSAILADATGTRLAGRTIVFVLGAQTKSAVTDGNGVATTTLQLNQKNAIYPLTATFAPAGGDVPHYLGSSDAKSFNLQKK
ncbi:MAG TPA: PKD domain-containing protein [Candidatus Limnocylindrales bacterium]|nr:PKD domain-containing protein [Candidatus Limnocylindrales bacterium]